MTAPESIEFPNTRAEALVRLEKFLPSAPAYASRRNHVVPGHGNVSRLSPATRTRLLLESELVEAARGRYDDGPVEKFVQEVWWRLYWKGWLEKRPSIWRRYREDFDGLDLSHRAEAVANGRSGIAILDHFARELIETGYLHNHARMWWAAWWIHGEGLPWQLGADHFLRHLLDGDAASNTLSWRWVAGLHTRGKNYLARRSNLEKYVNEALLADRRDGLERLGDTEARNLSFTDHPEPLSIESEDFPLDLEGPTGLWLHDEDLSVERSPLRKVQVDSLAAFLPTGLWKREGYGAPKCAFLERASRDGAERAGKVFGLSPGIHDSEVLSEDIVRWAERDGLRTIVAMRPFVGTLADQVGPIRSRLEERGVRLVLVRRPEEVPILNRATAGFFGFWKKTSPLRKTEPRAAAPRMTARARGETEYRMN